MHGDVTKTVFWMLTDLQSYNVFLQCSAKVTFKRFFPIIYILTDKTTISSYSVRGQSLS